MGKQVNLGGLPSWTEIGLLKQAIATDGSITDFRLNNGKVEISTDRGLTYEPLVSDSVNGSGVEILTLTTDIRRLSDSPFGNIDFQTVSIEIPNVPNGKRVMILSTGILPDDVFSSSFFRGVFTIVQNAISEENFLGVYSVDVNILNFTLTQADIDFDRYRINLHYIFI